MPTIIVRRLDPSGEPQRGAGLSNFAVDQEAVAQIVATRMQLLQGEWFENLADGTPLFQSLLDHSTTSKAVALILRKRILSSPYVTAISSLQVVYQPAARAFAFSAAVKTAFGIVSISSNP